MISTTVNTAIRSTELIKENGYQSYAKPYKIDNKMTAMMVEDMLFDPILAAKVLVNVKIPPHEELRITLMWTTFYTSDDSGVSTGKSWTFALVAALRSMLMPGRVSGMLSKTFAQGKLMFQNLDRWYAASKIFRSMVQHQGGKCKITHGSDLHQAMFRGGSEIRVLPPNFFQDAERIRSERWHDAYLDEWTTYGNFSALKKTIIGRITNTNDYKHCPVRQNHVHLGSTPASKHKPSYQLIKPINRQIAMGNKDYARFTCNWRHVPQTEEFENLTSDKSLYHLQTSLPREAVISEIDGIWSNDKSAYYNSLIIDPVRTNKNLEFQRTDPEAIYIGAFDMAPGGEDQTGDASDDFAFTVLKIEPGNPQTRHVLTYRQNGLTESQASAFIHKLEMKFSFSLIMCDPNGGGLFVRNKLREETQTIDGINVTCLPIITRTDNTGTAGKEILCMYSRGDFLVSLALGKMASDSVLVNALHKELKGAIENHKISLYQEWDGWEKEAPAYDVDAKRTWLNRNPGLEEHKRFAAETDMAVLQLILIDYERNKETRMAIVDSYGMYRFGSKEKKDSAYTLCYANMGVKIYRQLQGDIFPADRSVTKTLFPTSVAPI